MKLIEIKREYELNQNTFYGWLKENQMIVKEMTGYVIGPNALEGMETKTNRRVTEDGEVLITTQVVIDNQKIPQLIEQYEKSGLPRLFSSQSQKNGTKRNSNNESAEHLEKRIEILEKQVYIFTEQLSTFIKQSTREHE